MRRLVVNLLNLLSQRSKEKGFTLFELVIVSVIIGVVSAVAAPNLIDSQRQETVKRTFSQVRSALVEAQLNANRLSTTCTVTISTATTPATVKGTYEVDHDNDPSTAKITKSCLLETIEIDTNIVSLRTGDTFPGTALSSTVITFQYTGRTNNPQRIWIARKPFTGADPIAGTAKCIVVSSIGMIRTGIDAADGSCENVENKRYVP